MKNFINNIPKEKLQRYLFLGALILVFVAFFISLTLIKPEDTPPNEQPPVNNDPDPDPEPVAEKFKIPTNEGEYRVVRKFYDVNASEEDQVLAIIQFGSSYSTSNGISIAAKDGKGFSVTSAISGVVTTVSESPIHGFIITIEHDDDVFTEYSSLSEAKVKVGDTVKQGDVIGTSGESEYDEAAGNHVHFKIIKDNENYSPETLIGKELKDVK